jgi:peroxiredoxin
MSADRSNGLALRAGKGALAGVVFGVLVWLLAFASSGGLGWWQVLLIVGGGAVLCAVGQVVARGIVGVAIGAVLGFMVGSVMGGRPDEPPPSATPGKEAVLSGPTLDGKTLDIVSLRGKVVLIDFWATWCPPCVAEVPNIRDLYKRLSADGFEIIGVSLDQDRERLARFVQQNEMSWPQIIFPEPEQRGWDNPIARQYGVRAIPATLLIDREGRIIERNPSGKRLERAVASALAGNDNDSAEMAALPPAVILWGAVLLGGVGGILLEGGIRASSRRANRQGPERGET